MGQMGSTYFDTAIQIQSHEVQLANYCPQVIITHGLGSMTMIDCQLVQSKAKQSKLLGIFKTKHVFPIPFNTQLAASPRQNLLLRASC